MPVTAAWATTEERLLLESLFPGYEACQASKKYKPFWTKLFHEYFKHFPVIDKLYPGMKQSELAEVQKAALSTAIQKQQAVSPSQDHRQ